MEIQEGEERGEVRCNGSDGEKGETPTNLIRG